MLLHNPSFTHRFRDSRSILSLLDGVDAFLRDLDESVSPPFSGYHGFDETNATYVFTFALPGFKKTDVDISIKDDHRMVVVNAQRGGFLNVWTQSNPGGLPKQSVERIINLPEDADLTKVEAKLEDGILTVTVAKVAKPTPPAPRKVTVS